MSLKKKAIENYQPVAGEGIINEIRRLAADLKGLHVLQINSTSYGGGVAELLAALVPLEISLGIETVWKTLPQHVEFFEVTKRFHNALQGAEYAPSKKDIEHYLDHNRLSAEGERSHYDVVIAHDPQPAAFRHFAGVPGAKWVWRCHIDTSNTSDTAWDFIKPFVDEYDAAVFTMEQFLPPGLQVPEDRVFFIAPAIDPFSTKNIELPASLSQTVLSEFGIDPGQPLLTQVSRFDPWKDPFGVIRTYRQVKERVPGLQLALIGSMATDDPEALEIYSSIETDLRDDRDAFIFTNLNGVGSVEVNAFQRLSDVIIQKSIREGFGLVVSEALWKETPVVAGDTGGIPLQMSNGIGGFLADTDEIYADRIEFLLTHPEEAKEIAALGRAAVQERFLITRLLVDELKLLRTLVL
jgi:trehalose synthase